MIYLASPYSHSRPEVREARYRAVMQYAAKKMNEGILIFSPIVYGHEIAAEHVLPTDAAYWESFNFTFLRACTEMHILMLSEWQASVGIDAEIKEADRLGLPIKYVEV